MERNAGSSAYIWFLSSMCSHIPFQVTWLRELCTTHSTCIWFPWPHSNIWLVITINHGSVWCNSISICDHTFQRILVQWHSHECLFVSSMCSHMCFQITRHNELCITHSALIKFLIRMWFQMPPQVTGIRKPCITHSTYIWFLTRMCSHVHLQDT